MICSFFRNTDFPGFISSVIDVHCRPSTAEQVLSSQQRWLAQRCVQLYKILPLIQATPQCWLSHSSYHATHFGSIGRSAGMLGYTLWHCGCMVSISCRSIGICKMIVNNIEHVNTTYTVWWRHLDLKWTEMSSTFSVFSCTVLLILCTPVIHCNINATVFTRVTLC